MRGGQVIDVGAKGLEDARAALARAVASGALGPGKTVRRDGDAIVFGDGRIELTSDGRVTWDLSLRGLETLRVMEAVVVAILVAAVTTLGFAQPPYVALPVGAGVGVSYASARLLDDRKRTRARLRALLASLPVLVDSRRE